MVVRASRRRVGRKGAVLAAFAAVGLACAADAASAQGLFDFLFGGGNRRAAPSSPPVQAYAPPSHRSSRDDDDEPRYSRGRGGGYTAYCVRLCDGHYFPLQRDSGNPAQLCQSFCPAAQTKVYSGSDIDYATAQDGKRYDKLENAFLYREKVVPDCTCNGKTPFGLVRLDPKEDPTLRPGDIVATKDGLMAYSGSSRSRSAEFTPVQSYSGMPKDLRKQLSTAKILHTAEPKAPPQAAATVGQSSRETPRRARSRR